MHVPMHALMPPGSGSFRDIPPVRELPRCWRTPETRTRFPKGDQICEFAMTSTSQLPSAYVSPSPPRLLEISRDHLAIANTSQFPREFRNTQFRYPSMISRHSITPKCATYHRREKIQGISARPEESPPGDAFTRHKKSGTRSS